MGVLDIVDRVIFVGLAGQINVNVKGRVRGAHQKEEAGGVFADLVD